MSLILPHFRKGYFPGTIVVSAKPPWHLDEVGRKKKLGLRKHVFTMRFGDWNCMYLKPSMCQRIRKRMENGLPNLREDTFYNSLYPIHISYQKGHSLISMYTYILYRTIHNKSYSS